MIKQKTIDEIISLSKNDTKTISEKALKVFEEGGELSKAILPFVEAEGCNHRFPSLNKVVEEAVDTCLAALSIPLSLGVSIDEISILFDKKTQYWKKLVEREKAIDLNNLAFEIHITVDNIQDIDTFKVDCEKISVKPIILDLYNNNNVIKDIMTSSVFIGTTKNAHEYSNGISISLENMGYKVLRQKIETVPWHPASYHSHKLSIKNTSYYETHFAFSEADDIVEFSKKHNIKISKNLMKKNNNNIQMGTYRISSNLMSIASFEQKVSDIVNDGIDNNITILEKPIIEYALYDDNKEHDREWII